MPFYKVLVNGRFGEGWKDGDVVEMDTNAAEVPLKEGALDYMGESRPESPKTPENKPELESEPETPEQPKKVVKKTARKTKRTTKKK